MIRHSNSLLSIGSRNRVVVLSLRKWGPHLRSSNQRGGCIDKVKKVGDNWGDAMGYDFSILTDMPSGPGLPYQLSIKDQKLVPCYRVIPVDSQKVKVGQKLQ